MATGQRHATMSPMASLCVYCGSNTGTDPAFAEAAAGLGDAIARQGHRLVYGGGNVGLMGIVAETVLQGGADVIGVMTEQLVEAEVAHHNITKLEVAPTMHARKARMAELSDGVIVLPGGFGTWEEAVEILTWNQLGIVAMPVVFCDVGGFYRSFFELIEHANGNGFVSDHNRGLALRAEDPVEAVALATGPAPTYEAKWVG